MSRNEGWPNNAMKFTPYGRRTLASSRRLWRRYVHASSDKCFTDHESKPNN